MRLLAQLAAALMVLSSLTLLAGHPVGEVAAETLPSWQRVFHMHEGATLTTDNYDWMNSSGPTNPSNIDYDSDGREGISISKNSAPAAEKRHLWFLHPSVNPGVEMLGDLDLYVWGRSRTNESTTVITAIIYDAPGGTYGDDSAWVEVGRNSTPLQGPFYSQFALYHLTIPSLSYTFPAGHQLTLAIERGDSKVDYLEIMFDTSYYDSYVLLTASSSSFLSVTAAWTEDSDGIDRTVFSELEPIVVLANTTNPFGAYDTISARFTATYDSNGTIAVDDAAMLLFSADQGVPPYWKLFRLAIPGLYADTVTFNVTAYDAQGTPTWMVLPVTVVGVDHFEVVAPATVQAGSPFTMTVTAMNASGVRILNWVGEVLMEAYQANMVDPANGTLLVQEATFLLADYGQKNVTGQEYDSAEEIINIRVSSGARFGWSGPIMVHAGPVSSITVEPSGQVDVAVGVPLVFTAQGRDSSGNFNVSWSPTWTVPPALGSIVSTEGFTATFEGATVGTGNLTCWDLETGANASVVINVTSGLAVRIVISSPSYPLLIEEAESQVLTATGYDVADNVVDISGAVWTTNTSGTLVGSGGSVTYTAGVIPETGIIQVRLDSITAVLQVIVQNNQEGPWLNPIPNQIVTEDSGTWQFSLTGYWNDVDGTSDLIWWAEDVDTSLYFISHDGSSNAVMEFYTQPDKFGADEFMLWVIDPEGFRTFASVLVDIQPVNDAPEWIHSPPETLFVKFDLAYAFDFSYYVQDIDNNKSDLAIGTDFPVNVMFDHLIASFLFPTGSEDFNMVTFTLSDLEDTARITIIVRVTDDTPPSLVQDIPDFEMWEGEADRYVFDLDDYFIDEDNDSLYYMYGFDHLTVRITDDSNEVYFSALEEWWGVTEGTFIATDPTGALKVDTVKVTVHPVNDAPCALSLPTVFVRYDTVYSIIINDYVSDPDNSIDSLTFTIADPYIAHKQNALGIHWLELNYPANLSGPSFTEPYMVDVIIGISDPEDASSDWTFRVVVSDNYPPKIIALNPNQIYYTFPEDRWLNGSMRLFTLFNDEDDGDTLVFIVKSLSAPGHVFATIHSDGIVNLTGAPNWYGDEDLELVAYDPHGAWARLVAHVTVTEVNDAPWIDPIDDIVNEGYKRNAEFPVFQYLHDLEDGWSKLEVTVTPSNDVYYANGHIYVSFPEGVDEIKVTMKASDGEAESNTVEFTIGVPRTMAERIGYPYSLALVLLAAGVGGYFIAGRLPRPYKLENLFLIHNDGRLVHHVTEEENTILDKDVVSAMFTAVQEFVKDSFQKGEVGLKKLEIGDKQVVIEKGRYAYLALIYSGWPGKESFDMLPILMRDIEERYGGKIEKWNGTMKTVRGVERMLQEYMAGGFVPGKWHDEEELAEEEWVDILSKEA